ncbi:MAG TPA: hypothetical protein VGP24_16085 [Glaciihabitans sp.]|jgi:hypothetical protein|nr:hypothetical protein [Glaciihabitans sp.]
MDDKTIIVTGYAQSERDVPGSAAKSETPKACGTGAGLLLLVLWFAVPYVKFDVLGTVVVAAECVFPLLLIAVAVWAQTDSKRPDATLADLLPQRVIAVCLMVMAGLGWLLLLPL